MILVTIFLLLKRRQFKKASAFFLSVFITYEKPYPLR